MKRERKYVSENGQHFSADPSCGAGQPKFVSGFFVIFHAPHIIAPFWGKSFLAASRAFAEDQDLACASLAKRWSLYVDVTGDPRPWGEFIS